MTKYYEHIAGPDGWSDWSRPVQGDEDRHASPFYKLCCCDCGLVHDADFRVTGQGMVMRVRRNNRATGQVRRHKWAKEKAAEKATEKKGKSE